ncbi:MAG: hypothetical protein AB7J34_14010 [Limisphaerales bacterium]
MNPISRTFGTVNTCLEFWRRFGRRISRSSRGAQSGAKAAPTTLAGDSGTEWHPPSGWQRFNPFRRLLRANVDGWSVMEKSVLFAVVVLRATVHVVVSSLLVWGIAALLLAGFGVAAATVTMVCLSVKLVCAIALYIHLRILCLRGLCQGLRRRLQAAATVEAADVRRMVRLTDACLDTLSFNGLVAGYGLDRTRGRIPAKNSASDGANAPLVTLGSPDPARLRWIRREAGRLAAGSGTDRDHAIMENLRAQLREEAQVRLEPWLATTGRWFWIRSMSVFLPVDPSGTGRSKWDIWLCSTAWLGAVVWGMHQITFALFGH